MNNQSISQLTSRLTKALNSNYDVVDMDEVLFVISELEFASITKEQLETTRLAKYINQLRRRTTHDLLARRSKNLLKKWREMVMPSFTGVTNIISSITTTPTTTTITPSLNNLQKPPPQLLYKNTISQLSKSSSIKIGNISQQQQQQQPPPTTHKSQKRNIKQQPQQIPSSIDEPIFMGTNTELMYEKNSIVGNINNNNSNFGLKKMNTTSSANKNIKQFKGGLLSNGTLGNPINNINIGNINPYNIMNNKKKNIINKISTSSSSSAIGNNYNKNNNNGNSSNSNNSNNKKLSIQQQPISFANLLDIQFDNKNNMNQQSQQQQQDETKFIIIDENNSVSPKFNSNNNNNLLSNTGDYDCNTIPAGNQNQLSGLMQQQQQQQLSRSGISPLDINMEHSSLSLLEFDQNSYQNGLCNNLQQQRIRLLNGSGGVAVSELNINSSTTTNDLNDTNSNSAFVIDSNVIQNQLQSRQQQEQQLRNNDYNNRSEHRKNKKHKKDKKQRKEKQQDQQQQSLFNRQTAEPITQQNRYSSSNLLQSHENSLLNFDDESHTVGGAIESGCVGGIGGGNNNSFPIVMQENLSLSNSSISIFPNTITPIGGITTNILNNDNNNQKLQQQQKQQQQQICNKTDLTFTGKFNKNQTNITESGVIDQNINFLTRLNDRYSPSIINQLEPISNNNVVLIESRSCSPFTTIHCSNDNSCCSSTLSHLSLMQNELIDVINSNDSQGIIDPLRQSNNISGIRISSLQNIKTSSNTGGGNVNLYNETLNQQPQLQSKNSAIIINPEKFNNDNNIISSVSSTSTAPAPVITSTNNNNSGGNFSNSAESLKKVPKKRGRKKGSRGIDAVLAAASLTKSHTNPNIFMNSQYFESSSKLLAMGGSKKVKTTKELLADIQNRKIGSSATSSPTLVQQMSSSRAPSICSDPSRSPSTSDAATVSTIARSTPDQITVNIRDNSTDSDITTQPSSRTTTPSNQHNRKMNYDKYQINSLTTLNEDSILGVESVINLIDNDIPITTFINSSIEEEISELYKQLRPINEININCKNTDIPCTCTVCEIENIANIVFPNDNDNNDNIGINKNDNLDNNDIPIVSVNVIQKDKPIDYKEKIKRENALSFIKTDKPIKSIFDLDYDEDDDPVNSFKLYENKNNEININNKNDDDNDNNNDDDEEATTTTTIKSHITTTSNSIKSISDDENSNIDKKSIIVPSINNNKTETSIEKNNENNNNTKLNMEIDSNKIHNDYDNTINDVPRSPINMNIIPIPIGHKIIDQQSNNHQQQHFFPKYEIIEDPNCLAKQKYNIQTQLITKFHINALHNCYIPNVNGNWDCSIKNNNNDNIINNEQLFNNNYDNSGDYNKNIINDEINELNKKYDLYERVVPQYSYLIHDLIPKNLNHIQFTENYLQINKNKKKIIKLEKINNTINNIVINKTNNNNNNDNNENNKLNIYVKLCKKCNKQKIDKQQEDQLLSIYKNNRDNINNNDNDVTYLKIINDNDNELINRICSVNSNNFTKNILNNINNNKSSDLLSSSLNNNNNNSQFNYDDNDSNHEKKLLSTTYNNNKNDDDDDDVQNNLIKLHKNNNCDVIENICNSSNIFEKFLNSNLNENTENLSETTASENYCIETNLLNTNKNESNNNNNNKNNDNVIIKNINNNSCSTYLNNNNSVTKNLILNNQSSESLLNNPINLNDNVKNISVNQSIELPSTSSNSLLSIPQQQNYSNNQPITKIKLKLSGNDNNIISIISSSSSLSANKNEINENIIENNNNIKRRRNSSCSNSSLKQNQSQINLKLKKRLKLKLKEQEENKDDQQQIMSYKRRKKLSIKQNGEFNYNDDNENDDYVDDDNDLFNSDHENLSINKKINIINQQNSNNENNNNNNKNYNFDDYNDAEDDNDDDDDDDEDDEDGDNNNGDFHEVVTRDTSNVTDNNNKPHIVLTIKKTPNKQSSSPIPINFNNKINNKISLTQNFINNNNNNNNKNNNDIYNLLSPNKDIINTAIKNDKLITTTSLNIIDTNINNELNNLNDSSSLSSSLQKTNLLSNNDNNSNNNISILNKNLKAVLQSQSIIENDDKNIIISTSSKSSSNKQYNKIIENINSSEIINNDNDDDNDKFNLNINKSINNKKQCLNNNNNNNNNDDAGYDHDRLTNTKILIKRCIDNDDEEKENELLEQEQPQRKRHKKSHQIKKIKSFDKLFFPYELITSNNEKLFDNIIYSSSSSSSSDNNSNDSNYNNSEFYNNNNLNINNDDDNSNEFNDNNNAAVITDKLKFFNFCECSSGPSSTSTSSSPSFYYNTNNIDDNKLNQSDLINNTNNDYNSLPNDNNYVLKSFNTIQYPSIKNHKKYDQIQEQQNEKCKEIINNNNNNNSGTSVPPPSINNITNNIFHINDYNDDEDDDNNKYDKKLISSTNNNNNNNMINNKKSNQDQQQQYQFKEWHEVLHMNSYNDEPLTILPYVVID